MRVNKQSMNLIAVKQFCNGIMKTTQKFSKGLTACTKFLEVDDDGSSTLSAAVMLIKL